MTDSTEVAGPGSDVAVADHGGDVEPAVGAAIESVETHTGHPDAKQYVLIAVVLVIVTALEIAGLYWHFVDVVWIVIFTAVYLVPQK